MIIKTKLFYLSFELFMIFDEYQIKTTDSKIHIYSFTTMFGCQKVLFCLFYFVLLAELLYSKVKQLLFNLFSQIFSVKTSSTKRRKEKKKFKMSYFPNFLELQRSSSYMEKNDCQLPRNTMNELVMNYLVTG